MMCGCDTSPIQGEGKMPSSRRNCLERRSARGHLALAPNLGFAVDGVLISGGGSLNHDEGGTPSVPRSASNVIPGPEG